MDKSSRVEAVQWTKAVMATVQSASASNETRPLNPLPKADYKDLISKSMFTLADGGHERIVEGLRRIALFGIDNCEDLL